MVPRGHPFLHFPNMAPNSTPPHGMGIIISHPLDHSIACGIPTQMCIWGKLNKGKYSWGTYHDQVACSLLSIHGLIQSTQQPYEVIIQSPFYR